jgi:hypothetical protein
MKPSTNKTLCTMSLPQFRIIPRTVAVVAALCALALTAPAALLVHIPYDDSTATNRGTRGAVNDGTLVGGAVFTNDTALGNGAVYLDSALSSYVMHSVAAGTDGPITTNNPRTLSIWTKNSQVSGDGQRTLLSIGNGESGGPNGSKMDMDIDASAGAGVGRIEIGIAGGRTAPTYASPPATAANNNLWHLVTITWSTNQGTSCNGARIFVDGGLVSVPATPTTPAIATGNGVANDFMVGKSVNSLVAFPSVQQYFKGLVDDVSIFDTRFTDTEALGLYQVGTNSALKYDATSFASLKAVFDAGAGSTTIGSRTWTYATNLFSTGGLTNTTAGYVLVLNTTNRTGVANWSNVPPVIVSQPVSITNVVGTIANFTNFSIGTQPLKYQWFFSNAPIAGATSQTFARNPVQLTNAGPYFVVITNGNGATTSSVVTLTVLGNTPVFITAQPTNVSAIKGQSAALSLVVDGSPPFAYRWRKGGIIQSGATNNPHTIATTAYGDAGSWDVIITNNFGSITSSPAILTVLDVTPPVINNATNISVAPASPAGSVVSLAFVTATDDRDGAVAPVLTPPSGSLFPPGVTVVTASATDAGGNNTKSYFTVTVSGIATSQTNLFDNFEVSAANNDLNFEYNLNSRQTGVLAPVPYSELARNAAFGQFDAVTQVGGSTLYLNPNSVNPTFAEATPAHEFLESATYAVEVDVNPSNGAGSTNWAGIAWGSSFAHVFPDGTGDGMGILFRGSGQISTFQGSVALLTNLPVALPSPPYRVRIEVAAAAFGDGSPAIVRAFVNGSPIPLSAASTNWVKTNGFAKNFVVFSGNAQAAGTVEHTFDNFALTALPTIFASHRELATVAGASNQTFTVTVPPSLVATGAVSVVISNLNPAIARMVGESGGALTLNFSSGGTNRQTVTVAGLTAGTVTLRLQSPSLAVPIGGKPITVTVKAAQNYLVNGSFEESPVPAFPGYGNIPGWSVSDVSWNGVSANLDVGGALANNSVSGQGKNVAFLQSVSSAFAYDQMISTTISNLTAGRKYQVTFLANNQQNAQANASLNVLVDGAAALYSEVAAVGASALGYKPVGVTFTAAAATAVLSVSNTTFTASGLLVDDFEVKELAPGRWNVAAWTGDADAEIFATNTYTHAYNLGAATNVTLNGVLFTGIAGANPTVSGQFVLTNAPTVLNNSAQNNLTGASALLGNDFVYNGQTPQLKLQGLIPGASYRLTLFGGGFGTTSGTRVATFSSGGYSLTVDENAYGQGNGLRLTCDFVATSSTETIDGRVLAAGTFHVWAFANQFVAARPLLNISLVAGPQVRVAWPAVVTGYALQSSSTVNGVYTNVGITPTIEGAEQAVYQTPTTTRFYRLISQ